MQAISPKRYTLFLSPCGYACGDIARTIARDSYKRAMDACLDTKAWAASVAAMSASKS